MAAKRIASSSINWTALAERVPKEQKPMYNALKGRSDTYVRRVMANPEQPPKIDWAAYKNKIPIPGLVDSLKKQLDGIQVPFPADKLTPSINEQEKQAAQEVQQFIANSNSRIKEYQAKIAKWDDVLPFEEMTLEDYKDFFPEQAMDPLRKPTFWPHTPEEQLDYKPPEEANAQPAAH